MKTAIIIGGTFNPITSAHMAMGKAAKAAFPAADIFYVPSNINFVNKWKKIDKNTLFSDENRIHILQKIFKHSKDFKILDIEYTGKTDGTTYSTVKYLQNKGYENIYVCIGMDKITEIPHWYKYEELLQIAKIILFPRNIKTDSNLYTGNMISLPLPEDLQDISSTKIRQCIENKKTDLIKNIVPAVVYQFYKKREA